MNYDRIIKILTYSAVILFFSVLIKTSVKHFKNQNFPKNVKWGSQVVIGPPYPFREITGFLPPKKMLFQELKRRGVPPAQGISYVKYLKKYINNKDYAAYDKFSIKWSLINGKLTEFYYYHKNKFLISGRYENSKIILNRNMCEGNKIFNVVSGKIDREGFYWSLRKKLSPFITEQAEDIITRTEELQLPIPVNTKWKILFSTKGGCPNKIVYFSFNYPNEGTEEIFYYKTNRKYYTQDGKSLFKIPVKINSLENFLLYRDKTFLFRFPAPMISPLTGKITSVSPLTIENSDGGKLICKIEANQDAVNLRVRKGTVVIKSLSDRYKCRIRNVKEKPLTKNERKDFFIKITDYIKYLN